MDDGKTLNYSIAIVHCPSSKLKYMKAKKSYGQHFLNRPDIAEKIAESLMLTETYPRVLEIGPGQGALTKFLINKPFTLKLVEADADMSAAIHKNFLNFNPDNIITKDFLKLDLSKVFDNQPFCLIGNYPYNISTQILFAMIDNYALVPEMVGMFQREVAERVVAPPGSKVYGIISVLVQAFYEGKLLFGVDKNCFTPPPNVQSAVIRLVRKENTNLGCNEKLFRRVVKQAFSQRRKMLRNTLKIFFPKDDGLLLEPFFEKRPEQLSLEEFINLTKRIDIG